MQANRKSSTLVLTALWDSISVYIGPSSLDREDRREKNIRTTPPVPTSSTVNPCRTIILVRRPSTDSYIEPSPDHDNFNVDLFSTMSEIIKK